LLGFGAPVLCGPATAQILFGETILRKTTLLLLLVCLFGFAVIPARAQQFDLAFGVSTITAPDADVITGTPSLKGGAYLSFGGDFLFYHNFGVAITAAWRAHENIDQSAFQPFRPIFYEFNGVYQPPMGKRAQADLQGGIGFQSTRFYEPFFTCGTFSGCTNFSSSNHFMVNVGGGVKFYVTPAVFIEPMARFYFVHNNFEFSSGHAQRFGAQIGYSFKNRE
jgi:hypothetical protein